MNENINHPIKYLILTEMQTNCTHHHDAKQSLLFFFLFCTRSCKPDKAIECKNNNQIHAFMLLVSLIVE